MLCEILIFLAFLYLIEQITHYCDGNHHRGPAIVIFVSLSLKREMKVKDTNHHVASEDHVMMNS